MAGIDSLNPSLYFNAAAQAAKGLNKKDEDLKSKKASSTKSFSKIFSEVKEELQVEDFIPEIKGMTEEQAEQFLIDSVYSNGDDLKKSPTPDNLAKYKRAVSNFLKYVQDKCYKVENEEGIPRIKRNGPIRTTTKKVYKVVEIVNEKLESLAGDILFNQKDQLKIASKIGDISGLLIDLLT